MSESEHEKKKRMQELRDEINQIHREQQQKLKSHIGQPTNPISPNPTSAISSYCPSEVAWENDPNVPNDPSKGQIPIIPTIGTIAENKPYEYKPEKSSNVNSNVTYYQEHLQRHDHHQRHPNDPNHNVHPMYGVLPPRSTAVLPPYTQSIRTVTMEQYMESQQDNAKLCEKLRANLDHLAAHEKRVNSLQCSLQQMIAENKAKDKDCDTLKARVNELEKEKEHMIQETNQEKVRDHQQFQAMIDKMQQRIDEFANEQQTKSKEYEEERKRLRSDCEATKSTLSVVNHKLSEALKETERLKQENQNILVTLDSERKDQIQGMQRDLASMNRMKERIEILEREKKEILIQHLTIPVRSSGSSSRSSVCTTDNTESQAVSQYENTQNRDQNRRRSSDAQHRCNAYRSVQQQILKSHSESPSMHQQPCLSYYGGSHWQSTEPSRNVPIRDFTESVGESPEKTGEILTTFLTTPDPADSRKYFKPLPRQVSQVPANAVIECPNIIPVVPNQMEFQYMNRQNRTSSSSFRDDRGIGKVNNGESDLLKELQDQYCRVIRKYDLQWKTDAVRVSLPESQCRNETDSAPRERQRVLDLDQLAQINRSEQRTPGRLLLGQAQGIQPQIVGPHRNTVQITTANDGHREVGNMAPDDLQVAYDELFGKYSEALHFLKKIGASNLKKKKNDCGAC